MYVHERRISLMLKVAVCDDDPLMLEKTCSYLEGYSRLHPEHEISVSRFSSCDTLSDRLDSNIFFDIYLLDILMPGTNGIKLGEYIRRKNTRAVLIYMSSSTDYALDSYKVEAMNYLIKPLTADSLYAVLDRAVAALDPLERKKFLLRTPDRIVTIPYRDILYLEYYRHRITVHGPGGMKTESIILKDSFATMTEPLLADGRFVKISVSHIVNMQHICGIVSGYFEMPNGEKLSITRKFADSRQIYIDWCLGGGPAML